MKKEGRGKLRLLTRKGFDLAVSSDILTRVFQLQSLNFVRCKNARNSLSLRNNSDVTTSALLYSF